jgi:hypothetical protein
VGFSDWSSRFGVLGSRNRKRSSLDLRYPALNEVAIVDQEPSLAEAAQEAEETRSELLSRKLYERAMRRDLRAMQLYLATERR